MSIKQHRTFRQYHRLRNRWYSPSLGKFVSRDPIRYDAGDVNQYRFVGNNPMNGVDPEGLRIVRVSIPFSDFVVNQSLTSANAFDYVKPIVHVTVNIECGERVELILYEVENGDLSYSWGPFGTSNYVWDANIVLFSTRKMCKNGSTIKEQENRIGVDLTRTAYFVPSLGKFSKGIRTPKGTSRIKIGIPIGEVKTFDRAFSKITTQCGVCCEDAKP